MNFTWSVGLDGSQIFKTGRHFIGWSVVRSPYRFANKETLGLNVVLQIVKT